MAREEQERLNREHVADPQLGDYWHEMFVPYLVVLGKVGKQFLVCQKTKDVDRDHWTWDLDQLDLMTLKQIRERVTYTHKAEAFVADVIPRSHQWAVDAVTTP